MKTKKCGVCNKSKKVANFHVRSDNGELRNTCKDCQNAQALANRKSKK